MSGPDDDFEVLPDTTSDERDARDDERDTNDERLLAERPPHWA